MHLIPEPAALRYRIEYDSCPENPRTEEDNLAGHILAEATARFGYSSDAAILEATSRWIAERIGYDNLPRYSGLIILEDGSTIHCSREHGGLFFSLPAPLEPTE